MVTVIIQPEMYYLLDTDTLDIMSAIDAEEINTLVVKR